MNKKTLTKLEYHKIIDILIEQQLLLAARNAARD